MGSRKASSLAGEAVELPQQAFYPLFAVQQRTVPATDQPKAIMTLYLLRNCRRKGKANRQQHEHQNRNDQLSFGTAVLSFTAFFRIFPSSFPWFGKCVELS